MLTADINSIPQARAERTPGAVAVSLTRAGGAVQVAVPSPTSALVARQTQGGGGGGGWGGLLNLTSRKKSASCLKAWFMGATGGL